MFRAIQITASNHFVHFFSPCFICAPFFFSFSFNLNYNLKESHIENFEKKKNILKVCRNIFLFISLFFFNIYIYIFFFSARVRFECAIKNCGKILYRKSQKKFTFDFRRTFVSVKQYSMILSLDMRKFFYTISTSIIL